MITLIATGLVAPAALADLPGAAPVFGQAGVGIVQPGGLQGLANQAARPNMVEAEPPADQPADVAAAEPPADEAPEAVPNASPFEIRYLVTSVLMLAMISGGTFLVARPSGRRAQAPNPSGSKGKPGVPPNAKK
ncbi:MAG: hypothetical protein ACKOEX_12870 [Planctomycetia bacterium]